MSITIREALQLPDMVHSKLVAGAAGIDNPIRWVTIVEILDDVKRLQAGEFLITTGFGLDTDKLKRDRFISSLATQQLSGVAIHTGFYLNEIPNSFIEEANLLGFPLIEIPVELNFSTVTKAILQPIVNRQFEFQRYSEEIHQRLLNVALTGLGLSAIAQELADVTSGEVTIIDSLGYELVHTEPKINDHEHSWREEEYEKHSLPIQAGQHLYGTLLLGKPISWRNELDLIAMQHASTLAALAYSKDREVAAAERRVQGDFVDDLLSVTFQLTREAEARSRLLGYSLTGAHLIASLGFPDQIQPDDHLLFTQKLPALIKRLAELIQPHYLIKERSNDIILVLPEQPTSTKLLTKIVSSWSELHPHLPLLIGCSQPRSDLQELSVAAQEAVFSMKCLSLLARPSEAFPTQLEDKSRENQQTVVVFSQLAGYQFLFPYHHQEHQLAALWQPVLQHLLAYDEKHAFQLLRTIHCYFSHALNGRKTAEKLYIHRHTLTYRLQQIEELTGSDLSHASDRWQLELAIMAYRLHQALFVP
ncbi:PucR family transcriptional regulator [Brevibacillus daliensis]|uniref:PucR family transcriptional regulator n=1 Tax=Brevibacillus daliensis TaxID=2892995 RepID=UPI001E3F544C|nr:PucR family transcriptional regulator [Brevibacillus daliensis]